VNAHGPAATPRHTPRFWRHRLHHVFRAHLVALTVVGLGFGAWWTVPPRAPVGVASVPGIDPPATPVRPVRPDLPDLQHFTARDGAHLGVRVYPADADTVAVLLHGSGMDGRSLHALARDLAEHGVATAVVPDLRGHGPAPLRRGDVDHVGQLEEDLADLIHHLTAAATEDGRRPRIVVIGHSLGGGLALRFGGGPYGHLADAFVLLAPFLGHDAPTTRPGGGGWATPHVGRIAALTVLNALGVHRFDGAAVIAFALDAHQRADGGTPSYSHRLQTSFAPRDYRRDLAALEQPLLVVAGRDDASFDAERYAATVQAWASADVVVLDGVDHVGIVTRANALEAVRDWLAAGP
jgi:non-heme chloroperoxidase